MHVTFRCPTCEQTTRASLHEQALTCARCQAAIRGAEATAREVEQGRVTRCLVCPCEELFVRKDFPQRLGLLIIVLGFVASSIALALHQSVLSLVILIGTALVDAALYMLMGNVLTCYRCHAEYRNVAEGEHPTFSLEIHERYRQQAARMAESRESSGVRPTAQSPGA
jgi:hypothetical protein